MMFLKPSPRTPSMWLIYGNYHQKKQHRCVSNSITLSKFLCGEGSFMLLIELRDDPKRAQQRIADGFKLK